MLKALITAFALLCLFTINSEARQRTYAAHPDCNVVFPCDDVAPSPRGERVRKAMGGLGSARKVYTPRSGLLEHHRVGRPDARVRTGHRVSAKWRSDGGQLAGQRMTEITPAIVAHPPGCPSRAFCGCGAAVRVFGSPIRSLWLAANWFKFPRTAPAPGAVAVRRHHVFVLEADLGGGVWQVYDANSGGRRTRIHARSIAGYVIVNPHGAA